MGIWCYPELQENSMGIWCCPAVARLPITEFSLPFPQQSISKGLYQPVILMEFVEIGFVGFIDGEQWFQKLMRLII